MSLRILLVFISLFELTIAFGQEGILKGKVIDGTSKEPLGGVGIYIDKIGAATTKPDGSYQITTMPGSFYIEYKFIGYSPNAISPLILPGQTLVMDIELEPIATELGVLVVSAGKFEQKLEEVTVSMDVIKSTLIQNKNTTSADNIMEQIPGVSMLDGQANIRGGSGFSYGAGSRVMVLVDDLPILTADAGDVKWNFIPIENIEQVEVIKGASSALFGSSALNGVINFRTAYPRDSARTNVTVSTGIYDKPKRKELVWWDNANPMTSMASFSHTRQIKNLDLVLGGNSFSDEGYRQLEKEQRHRFNFGTRYRFKKVSGLSAGLNGNYMDTKGGYFILWQNADSAYHPQGGTVSDFHTKRLSLDPYLIFVSRKNNKHSFRSRYYQAVNTNNTNQESVSDVWYGEYQYQLHLKKDLHITSGVTGTYAEVHSDSLYGNHVSRNVGVFSQLDKKYKRLNISLGVRGEYFKVDTAETKSNLIISKDTISLPIYPVVRAGLNCKLMKYTFLRASLGQGYRFPSVAEKFVTTQVSGLNIYPNQQLKPETGWSAELGVKQAYKIGNFKGYLDLAGFRQEYQNMMEFTFGYWVPAGTPNPNSPTTQIQYFGAKSINVGHTRITGAEFTAVGEGKIRSTTFTLLAGYTYIKPIDLDYDSATTGGTYNGNILKYRFEHTAKIDLQADYKKWSTGISVRYNSFMKNIDASFQKELFNDLFPTFHSNIYILPGLKEYREKHKNGDVVIDYRISYKLAKEIKAAFIINNLLNREYMGRPGDVQAPRNFAFVLSARI